MTIFDFNRVSKVKFQGHRSPATKPLSCLDVSKLCLSMRWSGPNGWAVENYSDRKHKFLPPSSVAFSKGESDPLISGKSRLVKYYRYNYNLGRIMWWRITKVHIS